LLIIEKEKEKEKSKNKNTKTKDKKKHKNNKGLTIDKSKFKSLQNLPFEPKSPTIKKRRKIKRKLKQTNTTKN
jgi:hypothetical protein